MFSYDPDAGSRTVYGICYNGVPLNHITVEELRQIRTAIFYGLADEMLADPDAPRSAIRTELIEKEAPAKRDGDLKEGEDV